jgi:hypothetical protein
MFRSIVDGPLREFVAQGGKGPIQRLREGGFDLDKIKSVMLSHQHFDRKPSHSIFRMNLMGRLVS